MDRVLDAFFAEKSTRSYEAVASPFPVKLYHIHASLPEKKIDILLDVDLGVRGGPFVRLISAPYAYGWGVDGATLTS